MLDSFVEVMTKKASRRSYEDELTELMDQLPEEEVFKIASGGIKLAFSDGDGKWLAKYKDTPLFNQAVALEEECLQLESQRIQESMERQNESTWQKQDMLRLKKRMLDLELHKHGRGDDDEEGEEEDEEKHAMRKAAESDSVFGTKYKMDPNNPYAGGNHMLSQEALMADPEYAQTDARLNAAFENQPVGTNMIPLTGLLGGAALGGTAGGVGGAGIGGAIGQRVGGPGWRSVGRDVGGMAGGVLGAALGGAGGEYLLDRAIPGYDKRKAAREEVDGAFDAALQAEDNAALRLMSEKQGSVDPIDMAGRAMAHFMFKQANEGGMNPLDAREALWGHFLDAPEPSFGSEPSPEFLAAAEQKLRAGVGEGVASGRKKGDWIEQNPGSHALRWGGGGAAVGGLGGAWIGAGAGGGRGAAIGGLAGAGLGAAAGLGLRPSAKGMREHADFEEQAINALSPEQVQSFLKAEYANSAYGEDHRRALAVAKAGRSNINQNVYTGGPSGPSR